MNIECGALFPEKIEQEGTVMDYVDNEFVCIIKDQEWSEFECRALKSQLLRIDFVYKFDIAIFLLTLEDTIDTSDFIFNVHDNVYDESIYRNFDAGTGFLCTVYLIDKDNVVRAKRRIQLSSSMSNKISEKLRIQKEIPYMEAEFLCNLEGLQNTYEPFELQPLAYETETFK